MRVGTNIFITTLTGIIRTKGYPRGLTRHHESDMPRHDQEFWSRHHGLQGRRRAYDGQRCYLGAEWCYLGAKCHNADPDKVNIREKVAQGCKCDFFSKKG